jgi:hypothetical protein
MNINGIEYTIAEINRIVINYEKILQSKRQNWHKKKLEPVSEKLEPVSEKLEPVSEKLEPVRKWIPKIPSMLPLGISDPEFKVR